jgi:hypothetical protein
MSRCTYENSINNITLNHRINKLVIIIQNNTIQHLTLTGADSIGMNSKISQIKFKRRKKIRYPPGVLNKMLPNSHTDVAKHVCNHVEMLIALSQWKSHIYKHEYHNHHKNMSSLKLLNLGLVITTTKIPTTNKSVDCTHTEWIRAKCITRITLVQDHNSGLLAHMETTKCLLFWWHFGHN